MTVMMDIDVNANGISRDEKGGTLRAVIQCLSVCMQMVAGDW